jgi:2,4-dienoyl-CoA reductase-like NADH-dependent reductase (Old Yellow Enzyme family)
LQSLREPKHVEFRENYLREHALKIRAAVKMPLAYLGGIQSIEGVETAMADGFDCVAMGRILIHNPKIVSQWAAGTVHKSGCTACNRCVSMMYLPTGTHCVLTGPQDAALNKIAAGA